MKRARLKIMATPIGNLRDISLRALDELRHADVIFAEDTRMARRLIDGLGVTLKDGARLISCHSRNEKQRAHVVLEHLDKNHHVILLSDAGSPGISDPGSLLVQEVIASGYEVETLPGPSAPVTALMGAGIDTTRFAFLGFLPERKSLRKQMITESSQAGLALVIFESAIRTPKLLQELFDLLGTRRVVVARELTKLYECFHRGTLGNPLDPPLVVKGEIVVIVEAQKRKNLSADFSPADFETFITAHLETGLHVKEVATLVAEHFGVKGKDAYVMVMACKQAKYSEK